MIFRILPLLLLAILLPNWYMYHHFYKPKSASRRERFLSWLPSILLSIAALLLGVFQTHSPTHALCVNIFMFFFCAFAVPKVVFTLISLIGLAFSRVYSKAWNALNVVGNLARWAFCGAVIYGTFWGAYNYKVEEVEFYSEELPEAFEGYRIVHFADMHLGTFQVMPRAVTKIVELINRQEADVICFTGDMVNYTTNEMLPFLADLRRLRAKDGVYSILGNHDYATYVKWDEPTRQAEEVELLVNIKRELGWHVLLNSHDIIMRNGQQIAIIGVENDGKAPFPERGDLSKALAGTDTIPFKVLLSHDPSHWSRKVLPDTDIQLTLAGHTHAMQFSLFGWSPASWFYPENWGIYYHGDRAINVTGGVGSVMYSFRLGAWPEISCITLRKR